MKTIRKTLMITQIITLMMMIMRIMILVDRNNDTNNLSKTSGPMNNKTINFSIHDLFSDCQ